MPLLFPVTAFSQEVLNLEQILQEIQNNNPALKTYDSRAKGQDARVEGARAWMAPMVGAANYMTPYPGAKVMDENDRGAVMLSAEQNIPNPARTRAKAEYLAAQSSVTMAERGITANELRARAKELYYKLLVTYRTISFQKENRAIMQNMKKLAEIRYPYNQGQLNQVFKAEGRIYEAENMILMSEGEIRSAKISLNVLMYRSPDSELSIDTAYKVQFNPVAALDTAYLAEHRSDIVRMDRSVRAMQLNIEQMKKEAKPDFRVRYEHMFNRSGMMPNQYTLEAMVSVPIAPWSSKMYKSEVKSMSFERQSMQQQKEAMLIDMQGMVRSMQNDILSMQNQIHNYESKILPALSKNLKVSMLSYQENKLDLNTVIDGWETLNMAQINYTGLLQKFYQMIAEYEKNIEK